MFVLLGPSGSGKSTLLRMIAGLAEIDEGRVLLDGRDVTGVAPSDRGIGFVFQNYALFRNMTVADNVEFALRVRKVRAEDRRIRVEELLEIVGLAGFGGRRPTQLSGGQQQRVALARALASKPPILLLDEPFGALDAKIRIELRQVLRRIQRELGVTAIFVTHDQEEAFELGDRVGVMNLGKLVEVGPPEELYLRPRSAFVATFLGVSNFIVGESTPNSVRLGSVELPLGTEAKAQPEGQRVQVLFRPEDIEVGRDPARMHSTVIGRGVVEERSFSGAFERIRVRVDHVEGVRQITPPRRFGALDLVFEVTRPQPEALRTPLTRDDTVWIGARRAHVLAPIRFDIRIPHPQEGTNSPAVLFGRELAQRLQGQVLFHNGSSPGAAIGEEIGTAEHAEAESFGVAALDLPADGRLSENTTFPDDGGHLLVLTGPAPLPRNFLICVAVGEPGKVDIRLAERLAWRLGAEATIMTVLSEEETETPEYVQKFLDASARAMAARGVPTRTLVRHGNPATEIAAELNEGKHDLLVVGSPLPLSGKRNGGIEGAIVGRILRTRPQAPVLIVRAHEP
jgi:ABC-type Fe3+/spermidine/putrescine transport system ATPase subunit